MVFQKGYRMNVLSSVDPTVHPTLQKRHACVLVKFIYSKNQATFANVHSSVQAETASK